MFDFTYRKTICPSELLTIFLFLFCFSSILLNLLFGGAFVVAVSRMGVAIGVVMWD